MKWEQMMLLKIYGIVMLSHIYIDEEMLDLNKRLWRIIKMHYD